MESYGIVNNKNSSYINSIVLNNNSVLLNYDDNSNYYNAKIISTEKPQVLALTSGTSGNTINCLIQGIGNGLSNLIIGQPYYCSLDGNLTTDMTDFEVGVAISSTELLMKYPYNSGR